jgi:hypothetical protein
VPAFVAGKTAPCGHKRCRLYSEVLQAALADAAG